MLKLDNVAESNDFVYIKIGKSLFNYPILLDIRVNKPLFSMNNVVHEGNSSDIVQTKSQVHGYLVDALTCIDDLPKDKILFMEHIVNTVEDIELIKQMLLTTPNTYRNIVVLPEKWNDLKVLSDLHSLLDTAGIHISFVGGDLYDLDLFRIGYLTNKEYSALGLIQKGSRVNGLKFFHDGIVDESPLVRSKEEQKVKNKPKAVKKPKKKAVKKSDSVSPKKSKSKKKSIEDKTSDKNEKTPQKKTKGFSVSELFE